MNSQPELWITKKMGSDSALGPGSEIGLPWKRLHGAYVLSRCAELHREGQPGMSFCSCSCFFLLNWKQHIACLMFSTQRFLLGNVSSFFFFFFLHRLLPFPFYTHPCLVFKASLPVILLIYFHVFNLASSLNSYPDLGSLEFSNWKAAQAIFH